MDSQGRDAFDLRALRKSISEGTRLLYVAMTRAREKLCLIGARKDGAEKLWRNQTRAARIWKTDSMLDMIMPAVLQKVTLPETEGTAKDPDHLWRVTCVSGKTIAEAEETANRWDARIAQVLSEETAKDPDHLWRVTCVSGKTIAEAEETANRWDARIAQVLSEEKPLELFLPERAENAPLKTSVTTLARQEKALTEDDCEETLEDKRKTENAARTFLLSSVPSRPAFLATEEKEKGNAEAASIGTATHRFMRLLSLDRLREEGADAGQVIRDEWARMRKEGILSPEEAGMIRMEGVISYFRSDLGKRMLESGEVKREADFTLRMDAMGKTLVQGIIDCAFREEDAWILVDYKTDYNTVPEIFVPRHEIQMNWYRAALERLTGIPVREMWLFALRAGKAFPVKRIPLPPDGPGAPDASGKGGEG